MSRKWGRDGGRRGSRCCDRDGVGGGRPRPAPAVAARARAPAASGHGRAVASMDLRRGAGRGGLIGLTVGAWLSIDLLWVPADLRGRGLGAALLAEAERRAQAMGCAGAYVGTTSADARRFYERNGYRAGLVLADLCPGVTQVTLQKNFAF